MLFLEIKDSKRPTFTKQIYIIFYKRGFSSTTPFIKFIVPSWFTKFKEPIDFLNDTPQRYIEIMRIIRKMKLCRSFPLGHNPVIPFKNSSYFRSYQAKLIQVVRRTNSIPTQWRKEVIIRPTTLLLIPLKILTSTLRNKLFIFFIKTEYINMSIQKGFNQKRLGHLKTQTTFPISFVQKTKSNATRRNSAK